MHLSRPPSAHARSDSGVATVREGAVALADGRGATQKRHSPRPKERGGNNLATSVNEGGGVGANATAPVVRSNFRGFPVGQTPPPTVSGSH